MSRLNVEFLFLVLNERLARAPRNTRMGKDWQGQMNLTFDISVTAVEPFIVWTRHQRSQIYGITTTCMGTIGNVLDEAGIRDKSSRP